MFELIYKTSSDEFKKPATISQILRGIADHIDNNPASHIQGTQTDEHGNVKIVWSNV